MELGLFGGTFDPIHLGHLIVAEEVRLKLGLTKIIFIPAGNPWLKEGRQITRAEHRLAMVELATESNPYFEVSTAEIERPGPSYTVDTVEEMRKRLGPQHEVYFIAGPDALADLPRWKNPDRVATLCWIVGVTRPGVPKIELEDLQSVIPDVSSCVRLVDVPQIDITSTVIRERVRAGLSIRYLVSPKVEKYINEHKLYSENIL